jgi:hypothetical protein
MNRPALLSWPAVRRLALAVLVAAGLALAAAVIPAGMASANPPPPPTPGPPGPGGLRYATTTTVSSSADPSIIGQPVTYTATISPVPGGGTVGFTDNGTPITGCTAQPEQPGGTATCQATPAPGMNTIAAAFSGFEESNGLWELGSTGIMTQVANPCEVGLPAGRSLLAGHQIASPNWQYTLNMQTDGNLVEYGPTGTALWASGTNWTGRTNYVTMQTDGNLVIYNSANNALWQSGTSGNSAPALALCDDSSMYIDVPAGLVWSRSSSLTDQLPATLTAGQAIWSPNGQYTLKMQTDGNLVEYGPDGTALWASGTYGTGSSNHVTMQTDGNLVIYTSAGTALWASGTGGHSGSAPTLDLQNDSNLVIYSAVGVLWARW